MFLLACTEYGVKSSPKDVASADDTGAPVDTDTTEDTDTTTDTDTDGGTVPSTVPCDDVTLDAVQWWGSQPFAEEADPSSNGVVFYDAGFDLRDWSTVSMPDSGHNPAGSDRAYRAVLDLPADMRLFVDLQSDDGLWLWVNGTAVGHWGGGWQEEGCVNDEANCLETATVAPVEITAFVQSGDDVLAARVSNAVEGSYFMLHAYCVE